MSLCQPLGVGLDCCPWALLRSPDVQEVMALRGWRESGSLNPETLDLETRLAVESYCRGVSHHEQDYYERLRKEREAKAKAGK